MASWEWVALRTVVRLHEEQLTEHGGATGLRDGGLLESALSRPENLACYGEPDAASLAAAYAFGLARNRPFIDGNKRTAAVSALLFLQLNGYEFDISEPELVVVTLALAAGELAEDELAACFRDRIVAVSPPPEA